MVQGYTKGTGTGMEHSRSIGHRRGIIIFIIYRDVQRLTLDVIASSVFSYDTDVFNKDDNVFLKHLHRVFRNFDMASADLQVKIEVLIASKY